MAFESYIARRYLRPKLNLVTIISVISIAGISIGVAALIIILSVFNGFNGVVKGLLVGFDPHIRVTPVAATTIEAEPLLERLRKIPGITSAAPFIAGRSAIFHNDGLKVVQIRGMRPADASTAIGLTQRMTSGEFRKGDARAPNPIVLGFLLAFSMQASLGDTLSLLSQAGLEESFTQLAQPTIVRCIVTGIFESSNKEYDQYYAYTDIATARSLFALDTGVMGIEIRTSSLETSEQVAENVRLQLGPEYRVETWRDLHADLFAVMELERWAAYIILSLIIVVAVFNVLGSLTMTVIEKQRDIGILKAMGASDRSIMRVYLFEGALIGIIGTSIGLVIGIATCLAQQQWGFYKLKSGYFIIPSVPVDMRPTDVALIAATALVLAMTAALYPARRAARLLPADAVRWE